MCRIEMSRCFTSCELCKKSINIEIFKSPFSKWTIAITKSKPLCSRGLVANSLPQFLQMWEFNSWLKLSLNIMIESHKANFTKWFHFSIFCWIVKVNQTKRNVLFFLSQKSKRYCNATIEILPQYTNYFLSNWGSYVRE